MQTRTLITAIGITLLVLLAGIAGLDLPANLPGTF
jgi:hypothetical protein